MRGFPHARSHHVSECSSTARVFPSSGGDHLRVASTDASVIATKVSSASKVRCLIPLRVMAGGGASRALASMLPLFVISHFGNAVSREVVNAACNDVHTEATADTLEVSAPTQPPSVSESASEEDEYM